MTTLYFMTFWFYKSRTGGIKSNFSFWYFCVLGVSVLAIGIAHADIEELRKIASPTTYKNIFFASDFDDLPSIEREFISSICSEALLAEFKQHDEVGRADQCGIMGNNFTYSTSQNCLRLCRSLLNWTHLQMTQKLSLNQKGPAVLLAAR